MALPPDPKNEAEKGLKTGAEASDSVLKGIFDALVSTVTKILPGTASTSTDSETPTAPPPKSNPPPTQLNISIFKEAEELAAAKERQISKKTESPILQSKENPHDAEKELTTKQFAQDINQINKLPPTDRRKPPPKPRPYNQ